jgi:hypothetical protein
MIQQLTSLACSLCSNHGRKNCTLPTNLNFGRFFRPPAGEESSPNKMAKFFCSCAAHESCKTRDGPCQKKMAAAALQCHIFTIAIKWLKSAFF